MERFVSTSYSYSRYDDAQYSTSFLSPRPSLMPTHLPPSSSQHAPPTGLASSERRDRSSHAGQQAPVLLPATMDPLAMCCSLR